MLYIVVDRNTGLDVLKQQGAIDAEFAVLPTTHFVETHTHVSYIGVDREVAIEGIAGAYIHAPNDTAFINFDGIVDANDALSIQQFISNGMIIHLY